MIRHRRLFASIRIRGCWQIQTNNAYASRARLCHRQTPPRKPPSPSTNFCTTDTMTAQAQRIDIDEFLTLAIPETPQELHPFFESFQTLYSRKYVIQLLQTRSKSLTPYMCRLWHQLTNKLLEFFDFEPSKPYRVDVFNKFVRDFEAKLNQLRLVEMGVKVSKEIDSECRSHSCIRSLLVAMLSSSGAI